MHRRRAQLTSTPHLRALVASMAIAAIAQREEAKQRRDDNATAAAAASVAATGRRQQKEALEAKWLADEKELLAGE